MLLTARPLECYRGQICTAVLRLNQYKNVCVKLVVLYPLVVDSVNNNVQGVSCEKRPFFLLSEIAGVL